MLWKIHYRYAGVIITVCTKHGVELFSPTTDVETVEEGTCEMCLLISKMEPFELGDLGNRRRPSEDG